MLEDFMDLREEELRDGWQWLIGGGIFALALSLFIYFADRGLSQSTREQDLARTLQDLRSAQFQLGSGEVDSRLRVVPNSALPDSE